MQHEYCTASHSFETLLGEIGSLADLNILDFGCGCGGQTAWLAQRAARVVGCDITEHYIRQARSMGQRMGLSNLTFEKTDGRSLPFPDHSFDLVVSIDTFEHVMLPQENLTEIRRVLRPGGSFITRFGPLFYSPRGYHAMSITQVPFAQYLWGIRPVLELMAYKGTPTTARSWVELGMNQITFRAFRKHLQRSGLEAKRLDRTPVRGLKFLASLPIVGEVLIQNVVCHAVKPG